MAISLNGCAAGQPDGTGGQSASPSSSAGSHGADQSPSLSASGRPAPNLNASRDISCDITGKVHEFPIRLYGYFDVHGAYDHLLIANEGPADLYAYEELTVDSTVWARSNADPWGQPKGEASAVARLRRSIDRASGWTELGLRPQAGETLQRMKAAGSPVDTRDFGLVYPDGYDSSLSLELETTIDGSPVAMHLAGATLEADLTCGGRALTRAAAPPPWKPGEQSQAVSVAVPEDWELDRSDPTRLSVGGPDRQWIAVQGATASGLTLDEWTADGAAYFSKNWDAKREAVTGIMVAHEPAALATWHLPIDGVQTLFLNVSVVRDGWGYDIEYFSQMEREPADRAVFEQVLTSVAFGKQ
jgi:hypothetical protein